MDHHTMSNGESSGVGKAENVGKKILAGSARD
jgi:hypothetical protein